VRPGRRLPAFLLILLAPFCLSASGFASTLSVTNANDGGAGSLRGVLAAAAAGDTITFDPGAFPANGNTVINLTGGRLSITKDLTIQGPGAGGVTLSDSSDGILGITGTSTVNVTARVSGLTFANGNAASATSNGNGGGIYTFATTLALMGCVFSGNTASGGGGAIGSTSSTVSLTDCTFTGNTGGGGGALSSSNGAVSLTNCTLSSNTAGVGGAIINSGSTASLTNCTLVGNRTTAGGVGGGIYSSGTQLTLTNCTLVGNTAASDQNTPGKGGGIYNTSAATVRSCIINGNAAAGGGDDVFGSFTSGGSNLIGDPNGAAYGFTGAHDLVYVDPKLDPKGLGSNGGPTQTLAVLASSPAVGGDYNNATSTDQRGFSRTAPQHTIGAYEYKTSHTHLLWNNSDGRVMLWSVAQDGSFTLNGFGPYTDGAPNNKWSATAVATGPDGKNHLLWNNTDGRVMLWTVDDSGNFTLAGYGPYTDNAPDNKWSATAVSVGPDNIVHLLWNNTDHRVMLWNVAPDFSFTLAGYGPYTDNAPQNLWSATALATGPDNVTRIAWNNTDYRVMLWNVAPDFSFSLAGYGPYTDGAPQNKWSTVGVSVGPDNLTHLLWSNTDRRAMFWNVGADFSFTLAGYGPYTDNAPQNLWSAQALATGPDGLSHILWGNTDYRAMLWGVDNAFSFSVAGYGPYTDNAPQNLWSVTAVSAGP